MSADTLTITEVARLGGLARWKNALSKTYTCGWCGQPFQAKRSARYCRKSHRQMAFRQRHMAEKRRREGEAP